MFSGSKSVMKSESGLDKLEKKLHFLDRYDNGDLLAQNLLDVVKVKVRPGVGDGKRTRMAVLAAGMARGYSPRYICEVMDITKEDYKRYRTDPFFQEKLAEYTEEANTALERAKKLAETSAFDAMERVVAVSGSVMAPPGIQVSSSQTILERAMPTDKSPKIVINISQQQLDLLNSRKEVLLNSDSHIIEAPVTAEALIPAQTD